MYPGAIPRAKPCWDRVASGQVAEHAELELVVREAFIALRDPVYRYVFSIVGAAGDAEDLTQEVFIRLFQDLREGKGIENVKAWLLRVAHNLAIDNSRRSHFSESLDAPANQWMTGELSDSCPNPEARAVDESSRLRLLKRLSPQERRCMELRSEGLRYREIADVLGIRIPTVQTTLERAIRKIRGQCHE